MAREEKITAKCGSFTSVEGCLEKWTIYMSRIRRKREKGVEML
jgi:hypothetical protein